MQVNQSETIPFLGEARSWLLLSCPHDGLTVLAQWMPVTIRLLSQWNLWDIGKDTKDCNRTSRKEEEKHEAKNTAGRVSLEWRRNIFRKPAQGSRQSEYAAGGEEKAEELLAQAQGEWGGNERRPPNENRQRLLIQSVLVQGNRPPSLVFGRDSKASVRAAVLQRGKGASCGPGWRWWRGESGARLTWSRTSSVIGWGAYFAFSGWSHVGSRAQKWGKLAVIDES